MNGLPVLAIIVLSPLWPAYGEAVARDDLPWVHRTLRRSVVIGFAIKKTIGFRVSDAVEVSGIDLAEHGETAYEEAK